MRGLPRTIEGRWERGGAAEWSLPEAASWRGPQFFAPPTDGVAGNGKPILNWDQAAAQLTRDSAGWGPGAVVTYAFRSTAPASMPGDTAGFSRFSAVQIEAAEIVFALWADVADISFVRVGAGSSGEGAFSNAATILFGNYSSGEDGASAFAFYPGSAAASSVSGDVWVNISLDVNQDLSFGSFGPHVLAHEIGHAIGLAHPGDYNAGPNVNPTYDADAVYWQDARMFTIMSYFGSSNAGGNLALFSAGPQLHDIAAAQLLYGVNLTTRTGDTVYGFNSNTGRAHSTIADPGAAAVFAIWDAGGIDTLDLSGYATASEIDLREEAFSNAGLGADGNLAIGNIAIARGAIIENAIGGAGDDLLIGNAWGNLLDGGLGSDTLQGGAGDDTYLVSATGDVVSEQAGAGADEVRATVSWSLSANVERLVLLGAAAIDGIGNSLANVLTGNAASNSLTGNGGNDTLNGGGGADVMAGGSGNDAYFRDNASDLLIENAASGTDTVNSSLSYALLSNFEHLTLIGAGLIDGGGNSVGNLITGNGKSNVLKGFAGDDTIDGGAGNDTLYAGSGKDLLAGGSGKDAYIFNTPPSGAANRDVIADYSLADTIFLDSAVFVALGGLGTLAAEAFHSGAGGAHDGDDRIIYNPASGALFYDPDGVGGAAPIHFASLGAGLTLTHAEFVVI